jgi:hypothetical protein
MSNFDRTSSRDEQKHYQKDETDSIADPKQTDPSRTDRKSPVKLAAPIGDRLKTILKTQTLN